MARSSLLVLVLVLLQPLVLVPSLVLLQQQGLACLQFVILKLQFDPLSLDIYHPLVGLVVGLVAVWVLIAWLLCRPNFFVAASSWVVSS
jgi:hypothetical protein